MGKWESEYGNANLGSRTGGITTPAWDSAEKNTKLLLHLDGDYQDRSRSRHTVTAVNTPTFSSDDRRVQSLVFDGSSSYLTVPDHSDWDIAGDAAQDYTIDFWVKHTDHAGTERYVDQYEDGDNRWFLQHADGSGISLSVRSGGGTIIFTGEGGEITDTNWHHVALIKKYDNPNTLWGIYKDGTQVAYVSDSSTDTFSGDISIGRYGAGSAYFDGSMSNLRIQKSNIFNASPNVGKTDTITVPDPNAYPIADANTALLLTLSEITQGSTPATIADSGVSGHDVTEVNTPTYDTGVWGSGKSLVLNGTNQYLTVPDHSDWDVVGSTSQDYTIDFWVKHTDHDGTEVYVEHYEDGDNRWTLSHTGGSGLAFVSISETVTTIWSGYGGEITDNSLHHVALVKATSSGPTVEWGVYLDGIQKLYVSDDSIDTYSGVLGIGRHGAGNSYFDGQMDNLRISKSNIFNAAPNSGKTDTITIPTSTPTADDDTVLLLNFDNSDATDTSQRGHIVTNVSQNAVGCGYWYGKSVILNGTDQRLTIPDSDNWDIAGDATQDYTIDFWAKHTNYTGYEVYLAHREDTDNRWVLRHQDTDGLRFFVFSGGVLNPGPAAGGQIIDSNWHHVTVIKVTSSGPTVEWGLYKDGIQISYQSNSTTDTFAGLLTIGSEGASNYFDGQLDEIRISKSNIFNAAPNVGLTDTITVPTRQQL